MKFSELKIKDTLKAAIQKKGFTNASEIQQQVIPAAITGKDIVGKSKTGTGKTAAFSIPLIELIQQGQGFSALIVTPTRELAQQVKEEIVSLAEGSRIRALAVYGSQNIVTQIKLLKRKPEIIVGTPGRLLDLINRRELRLQKTKFLVLDEADKMFDMGFRDDVKKIISYMPKERQTLLFSATLPQDIVKLMEHHLKRDKIIIDLSEDNAPVQEIEQFYAKVDPKKKVDFLYRILKNDKSKILVFCRTKRTVDWLEKQLHRRGINSFTIHGDKGQNARNKMIELFKKSTDGILLATDVVARGIHVDDIGIVINFDFPSESETYLHRIGRTARQGRKGKAISFCVNIPEIDSLEKISNRNNTVMQELR